MISRLPDEGSEPNYVLENVEGKYSTSEDFFWIEGVVTFSLFFSLFLHFSNRQRRYVTKFYGRTPKKFLVFLT